MQRIIKDKLTGEDFVYCEAKDIIAAGVSDAYLWNRIKDNRNGKTYDYQSIPDPYAKGSGAHNKKLILVSSLPEEVRTQVSNLLEIGKRHSEQAMQITALHDAQNVTARAVQVVEGALELTVPYVEAELKKLRPSAADLDYFRTLGADLTTATAMAAEAMFWEWSRTELLRLGRYERHTLSAFAALVAEAVQGAPILERVWTRSPNSIRRTLADLTTRVSTAPGREFVSVAKLKNDNALKLKPSVEAFIKAGLSTGNKRSVSDIWREYCERQEAEGWEKVTLQGFSNWCKPYKNTAEIGRIGLREFVQNYAVTVNRSAMDHRNVCWSFDGSPINAFVMYKGKARQNLNRVMGVDVATNEILGISYCASSETPAAWIEAIQEAIRHTGYLPLEIEGDHFSGWQQVEAYCKTIGIDFRMAKVGKSRSKVIERVFGHYADMVERKYPSFSGLNRYRDGKRTKVSAEFLASEADKVLTWEDLMLTDNNEGRQKWNTHRMEQLWERPCGKSPAQLAKELPSATPQLSRNQIALYAWEARQIGLTKDGLTTKHLGQTEHYFPSLTSAGDEMLRRIAEFLNRYIGTDFNLYMEKPFGDAYVTFTDGRDTGFEWTVKQRSGYSPKFIKSAEAAHLAAMLKIEGFQITDACEDMGVEPKEAKKRASKAKHPSKDQLNANEEADKLSLINDNYVNTKTGEIVGEYDPYKAEAEQAQQPEETKVWCPVRKRYID